MIWQEATSHHPSRQQMHSSSSSESIATGEDSIVAVGLVWPISTNERSLHCILHSCILFLYNGPALSYPQNCPFLCGNTDLLEPTWVESPHPKCHLDWFHHIYVAHQYAQHADTQTMLHQTSIATGCTCDTCNVVDPDVDIWSIYDFAKIIPLIRRRVTVFPIAAAR